MSQTPEAAWIDVRVRRKPAHKGTDGRAALAGEVLLLAKGAAPSAAQVRVRLDDIDGVALKATTLTLSLAGGAALILDGDVAPLADRILAAGRSLPELTRALRSFGSSRSRGYQGASRSTPPADDQLRFFEPLLAARRRAAAARRPGDALAAFQPDTLRKAFETMVAAVAAERCPARPPACRALEAELSDAIQPLITRVGDLQQAADHAAGHPDRLDLWRAWSAAVAAVFEAADRAWEDFSEGLSAYPRPEPPTPGAGGAPRHTGGLPHAASPGPRR